MDPGRFHSGRWFLLAEGLLVSAFGVAGLVSAALHPPAGPTGAPVLGLASTPAQSAVLLGLGVAASAAAGRRRAAITVTAVSAVAYTLLLFFSSVATARARLTPFGFHAADIVLHGVLAAVNFALLMWFIPDELGDEVWAPRRGRDRGRGQAHQADRKPGASPPAPPSPGAPAQPIPSERSVAEATRPPSSSAATVEPVAPHDENSRQSTHLAARATGPLPSRSIVPVVAAVLAAAVGVIVWLRRR